jgi:integrase
MSIYKRGNKYWYKFRHRGILYCEPTGTTNERDAGQIETVRKGEVYKGSQGIVKPGSIPTLRGFEEQFLTEVSTRSAKSPSTIRFYTCKYKNLLEFPKLADAGLEQISHELVAKFIGHMLKQDYERATVNHCLATLRKALRMAAKWRIIGSAPQIEMLTGANQSTYVLPKTDQERYLAEAPEHLANYAALALETGCRESELIQLLWEDIKWEPVGKATLGLVHVRGTKSKNSNRYLSLTRRARAVLKKQKDVSKCGSVFVRVQDDTAQASYDSLNSAHSDTRAALNLPKEFKLHSLRHTFATRLGQAGADAFTIMKVMGHSSITISQRYVHPTAGQVERAFVAFEELNLEQS